MSIDSRMIWPRKKTEDSLRQQVEFSRQSPIDGFPSLTMDVGVNIGKRAT